MKGNQVLPSKKSSKEVIGPTSPSEKDKFKNLDDSYKADHNIQK